MRLYLDVSPPLRDDAIWFCQGGSGPPDAIHDAPLAGLQAFAQVVRHGKLPNQRYLVHDLSCLEREAPSQRPPKNEDFTSPLQLLTRRAWEGESLPRLVVVHSLSRLWEKAVARVAGGIGSRPEVMLYGRALVADALHQLISDLEHGGMEVWASAWTTESGKIALPQTLNNYTKEIVRNAEEDHVRPDGEERERVQVPA